MPLNATQQFSATVSNDPANAGVNWTLSQDPAALYAGLRHNLVFQHRKRKRHYLHRTVRCTSQSHGGAQGCFGKGHYQDRPSCPHAHGRHGQAGPGQPELWRDCRSNRGSEDNSLNQYSKRNPEPRRHQRRLTVCSDQRLRYECWIWRLLHDQCHFQGDKVAGTTIGTLTITDDSSDSPQQVSLTGG